MSLKSALEAFTSIPPITSELGVEKLRELGFRNRFIEVGPRVGKNAGLWNIQGSEMRHACSDIGKDELVVMGTRQPEPIFVLDEKSDVELASKSSEEKVKIEDMIKEAMYVVVPVDFPHKSLMKPGIYVLSHSRFDRSVGLTGVFNEESMHIDGLDILNMNERDFTSMYAKYAEAVASDTRVSRALKSLVGNQ